MLLSTRMRVCESECVCALPPEQSNGNAALELTHLAQESAESRPRLPSFGYLQYHDPNPQYQQAVRIQRRAGGEMYL